MLEVAQGDLENWSLEVVNSVLLELIFDWSDRCRCLLRQRKLEHHHVFKNPFSDPPKGKPEDLFTTLTKKMSGKRLGEVD